MPANLSTMSTLFKTTYEAGIKNQLNSSRPLSRMFENVDTRDWTGTSKKAKVRVNRNRGSYAAAERGAKPGRGQQRLEELDINMRYIYGGIELTEQLIKFSRSDASSVARAQRFEMEGLVDDMRVQSSFYMCTGYGAGIRCLANGDPTTTLNQTVDAPGGVAGATNGARYLNVGDMVAWVDPDTGTIRSGGSREITAINSAGTQFTVSAAIDTATETNDQVVKAYALDASCTIQNTDYMHAPMGLLGLFDDGTYLSNYFGISRTSYPIMQSYVLSNVSALSADVVMRAIHNVYSSGQGKPKYHWMHPSVLRSYITLTQSDRRYTAGELMTPDAGTNPRTPAPCPVNIGSSRASPG